MTGNSGRKAAQKMYPATRCERCGGTRILQRHHRDRDPTNNQPANVEILCLGCHVEEHHSKREWGRGKPAVAQCEVCKDNFQPKRSCRAALCGRQECAREKGRRSAALRWAS